MSNRKEPMSPDRVPGPDECYAARCGVVEDRVGNPAGVDLTAREVTRQLMADVGSRRRSQVWITRHFAQDGRRRYLEIIGEQPAPSAELQQIREVILAKLGGPRSMLITAWCLSRKPETAQ